MINRKKIKTAFHEIRFYCLLLIGWFTLPYAQYDYPKIWYFILKWKHSAVSAGY